MDSTSSDDHTTHTLSNHGPLQLPSSLIMTSDKFDGSGIFSSSAFDRRKRDNDDDDEISNSETGTSTTHRQEVQSILQKTLMDESLLHLEKHGDFSALVKQAPPPPSLSRHSSTGADRACPVQGRPPSDGCRRPSAPRRLEWPSWKPERWRLCRLYLVRLRRKMRAMLPMMGS